MVVQAGLSSNWKQKWNAIAADNLQLIHPEQVWEERKHRNIIFEGLSSEGWGGNSARLFLLIRRVSDRLSAFMCVIYLHKSLPVA